VLPSFYEVLLRKPSFLLFAISGVVLAACAEKQQSPPPIVYSWVVDCVAVLGIPPPSTQTPLEAIALSGLPRDKFISQLTDDELVTLADFDACVLNNGYERAWFNSSYAHIDPSGAMTNDPHAALYQDETLACLADLTHTVYATPNDELPDASGTIQGDLATTEDRNENVYLLKHYDGACQVGPWEDCTRIEAAGGDIFSGPCRTTHVQCNVP
jgi:hypothetical protein